MLKFLGDGVLAVVSIPVPQTQRLRLRKPAMDAADEALKNLQAYNANPCEDMRSMNGWTPIRCGIAMHIGEVFFGNVGGQDRLDFTVIGSAVNEASRLEASDQTRDASHVVMSQEVGDLLKIPLDDIGQTRVARISSARPCFRPKALEVYRNRSLGSGPLNLMAKIMKSELGGVMMRMSVLLVSFFLGFNPGVAEAGCRDHAGSGVEWTGCSKKLLMLQSAKLDGAKLVGSNLTSTDLTGANLDGANLNEADLSYTSLKVCVSERSISRQNRRKPYFNG